MAVPSPSPSPDEGKQDGGNASQYEQQNVHEVYEAIAPHFSSTRYKPWPIVSRFLQAQPAGAVGIDVGCGNGKYLGVNPGVFMLGSDRSGNLVKIASSGNAGGNEVVVADSLALPFQSGRFDFAISIAVVHHLSTAERRREAIRGILECLKMGGEARALIYVWALEQKGSRRGWDEGCEQDVMVPWVMKGKGNEGGETERTFQRYYHLYRKGELEEDVKAVGGKVLESGYEKDNWWAVCGT
jgi:tRNA (uracil-5-)-methyltransferase TRM9